MKTVCTLYQTNPTTFELLLKYSSVCTAGYIAFNHDSVYDPVVTAVQIPSIIDMVYLAELADIAYPETDWLFFYSVRLPIVPAL